MDGRTNGATWALLELLIAAKNLTRVFIKELKKINHENKIYESKFLKSDPIFAYFGDGY